MSIEEKISKYKKSLDIFPNAQEKYQYLIASRVTKAHIFSALSGNLNTQFEDSQTG